MDANAAEVRRAAAELGADLTDNSARGELRVNLWLPAGLNWVASDGHSLSIDYLSDPAAGWTELLADVRLGTTSCVDAECDTCAEGR